MYPDSKKLADGGKESSDIDFDSFMLVSWVAKITQPWGQMCTYLILELKETNGMKRIKTMCKN